MSKELHERRTILPKGQKHVIVFRFSLSAPLTKSKHLNQKIQSRKLVNSTRLKVGCKKGAKSTRNLALALLKLRFRNKGHELEYFFYII